MATFNLLSEKRIAIEGKTLKEKKKTNNRTRLSFVCPTAVKNSVDSPSFSEQWSQSLVRINTKCRGKKENTDTKAQEKYLNFNE